MKAGFRREDQAAAVGDEQFVGRLGIFRLGFLLGDEHAVAPGQFHLHVGDAGAGRSARAILHGEFGDAREFPESGEVALVGDEGILRVHVQASEQRGRAVLEQDAAVAHVAARAALVHFGGGIAVERERQAQLRGLLAQPRQDRGVAPIAQDQVGIVPREQMLEGDGGGLARFVEFELAAVHLDFERGPCAPCRGSMPFRPPRRTRRISSGGGS